MKTLKLGSRIYLLVFAGLMVGALASSFLLWRLNDEGKSYDALFARDVKLADDARVMQVNFKKEVQEWKNVLLRGHVLEDYNKYRKSFQDEQAAVIKSAEDLKAKTTDPAIVAKVEEFIKEHDALGVKYQSAIAVFEKSQGKDSAAADAVVRGQDRVPTDLCDAIVGKMSEGVEVQREALDASMLRVQWIVSLLLLGAFVAMLVVSTVLIRGLMAQMTSMTSSLRDGSEQVLSAAAQVSTSAQSLSQGATEQASSLEETSASMEEMASMTRKNSQNASDVAKLVVDVAGQVHDSNDALAGMVSSMAAIQESSNKVAKIIKTIDEIAFQTNILALNAAVEAARAGEAGMGFAVVADEVRNLAQRSAQAAKDTAGLIEESIARAQEGNTKVEDVARSIGSMTESITRVKGMVEEVRQASQQQTQGIDQVTLAITQMEKVTQTTAATAEESAAASEELNAQAETSMTIVRELELLVGSAVQAGPKAARHAAHTAPSDQEWRHAA
ncbi:MAG: methyl-accepting chemotaxis protein [Acidobacteriota bacterium]